MTPKVIKNDEEYAATLARIEEIFDAVPDTLEGDELELLSHLVEEYEEAAFPMDLPDPITAIRFRMEQQNLKAKDLVPYIGSASKVSEVLSGQRNLSLTMIRNLVDGLGIPPEVLLRQPGASLDADVALLGADKFPIAEMVKRGWFWGFQGSSQEARKNLDDLLTTFMAPLNRDFLLTVFNRQHVRASKSMNDYALKAWHIRVAATAMREEIPAFCLDSINHDFLRYVAQLSYLDEGPRLAREALRKNGIHLVTERHLPGTYLDGAALRLPNESPVIAITLRYDRLDNFWFTLLHELAHVKLHLYMIDVRAFYDDLDHSDSDKYEQEADRLAMEALVPTNDWKQWKLLRRCSREDVIRVAESLRVHPAILAGRIRFEKKDYSLLSDLVGQKKVRCLFED